MNPFFSFRSLLIVLMGLANAQLSFADVSIGGMDSGGGHGVVCFDKVETAQMVKENVGYIPDSALDSIRSIDFLDAYFARMPVGMEAQVHELVDTSSFTNGVEVYRFLKDRLKNTVPELYQILDESEKLFEKTGITWGAIGDRPLGDTGFLNVITDRNCTVALMAYQQTIGFFANYLHVDHRLYLHPKHNLISAASLWLHEFLYLNARQRGEISSESVNMLVRLIIRKNLNPDKLRAEAIKVSFIKGL